MKRAFVNIPEGQVHYRTEGSGEPIILLHQYPTSSHGFIYVIPIMAKSYRVIAMDTLGYGDSEDPPREYEIEDYARSVVSFIDALGIEKTNIFGHHTGASIAVEVAATNPKRVDKLILSGCPTFNLHEWDAFLSSIRFRRAMTVTEDGSFLTDEWERSKRLSPYLTPEVRIKLINDDMMVLSRPYDAHLALERYDIKPRVQLIESPTLLTYGSRDVLLSRLEATKNLIPRNKTKVIEDAGIYMCYEKPEEFAQAVLDFLENPGV